MVKEQVTKAKARLAEYADSLKTDTVQSLLDDHRDVSGWLARHNAINPDWASAKASLELLEEEIIRRTQKADTK